MTNVGEMSRKKVQDMRLRWHVTRREEDIVRRRAKGKGIGDMNGNLAFLRTQQTIFKDCFEHSQTEKLIIKHLLCHVYCEYIIILYNLLP